MLLGVTRAYMLLKETRDSYFCEIPKNHRLMFAS